MGRVPTIYYCPYDKCTASYDRKHRYETHIRSHTGERPFVCSHEGCGKNFTSSSHLKRHEDTHGSSYKCTYENCLEVLKTKATLKKHIKIVHLKIKKNKVYTCTQCGKEFNKHNTLQRHVLRHSGQLPYKCSVEDCQKEFLTPSKLKRHMKVHQGYPCTTPGCEKVFDKWTLYVQHIRDFHRPEHRCPSCNKVFTKLHALKLHLSVHEESRLVYPCEVPNCSRYYFAERNLKWHMRKYHAKRPYMCDKENCHRAFKTEAELADHISYHGKKKPRKKKNKKPKPSLAAILSGVAEVKQVNRKSKEVQTEEKAESDVTVSSRKLNLNDTDHITTKLSSTNSLDPNQLPIIEEIPSALDNERTIDCTSKIMYEQNLFESCQLNTSSEMGSFSLNSDVVSAMEEINVARLTSEEKILEVDQSIIAEELDSVRSTENHIPIEHGISSPSIELNVPETAIKEYTTIEVVNGENLSQIISVPVIQIDDKHWNTKFSVQIETIS